MNATWLLFQLVQSKGVLSWLMHDWQGIAENVDIILFLVACTDVENSFSLGFDCEQNTCATYIIRQIIL